MSSSIALPEHRRAEPQDAAAASQIPATTAPTSVGPMVYLVGAGPGDPGLITLRAAECLRRADVVLYDYLVNPAVLEHVRPTAALIPLGRRSTGRGLLPHAIGDRMIAEAKDGRVVVRLKGGDPSVFGRGADEEDALRAAGVPYEIVPGITAGLAVAAYCEIPITHHDDASAVALVTGRERDDKAESHLDWGALAGFPGTLVLYMGVTRAAEWSEALIAHGKSPDTPVAIVRWCTRAEQRAVRCTVGTAPAAIAAHGIRPPAVIVIGDVVSRAPEVSWFQARPLFGVRVLVPGSPMTSQALRDRLSRLGADAVIQPAIQVTPPDQDTVDAALDRLSAGAWIVFSNAAGVDVLIERLLARGRDLRDLAGVRIAAIGAGTADRLARFHVRPDHVPPDFDPAAVTRALEVQPANRVLLIHAGGGDSLAAALEAAGAAVDHLIAYRSAEVEEADPDVADGLASGEIGWVAITSSAIARSVVRLYGDALRGARFVTIGPLASATLRALGHEPAAEASPSTTDGLVAALMAAHRAARAAAP
jgi:uroporphyrinogen III methyltransferase / synthase